MGADINRCWLTWASHSKGGAKAVLPGEDSTDITTEMLITDWGKVGLTELTPLNPLSIRPKNALKLILLPGVNNGCCSVNILAKDQTMDRNIAKIKLISIGIEVDNILIEVTDFDECHWWN